MKHFEVYTDGSYKDGWGSWSFIVVQEDQVLLESLGRERKTDSNRMEFQAAIEALRSLPEGSSIKLHTDCRIMIENIPLFVEWEANKWMKTKNRPIPNVDLFITLHELLKKRHVTWHWVRAHSGNQHNERCDELCIVAREA